MTASRTRFDTRVNYYQILDVAPGATTQDITRAYRKLMRLTHPDNFQEPVARAKAEERAKLINAAYAVLSRPEARRAYDDQMRVTAISDTLMQRYTGSGPGRGQVVPRSRPVSPSGRRAQRRAYSSAVRQLVMMTAVFVLALMLVIFALGLAGTAWDLAWDGMSALAR